MLPRSPAATPIRRRSTRSTPSPGAKTDVAHGLAQALQAADLAEWYRVPAAANRRISRAQPGAPRLPQARRPGEASPIPAGKPIKPGRRDPRMPRVAAALERWWLSFADARQAQRRTVRSLYAAARLRRCKQLQARFRHEARRRDRRRHTRRPQLGPGGSRAPAGDRDGAAALARARSARRRGSTSTPPRPFLDYWRDGQHVDRRKVVTGEPDKQTPQLQARSSQLVANPKWRVPDWIAAKELANKGSGWLRRTISRWRTAATSSIGAEELARPRQIRHAGPRSRSTCTTRRPRRLFALPDRHRSHGCVRVAECAAIRDRR